MAKYIIRITKGYTLPERVITWENHLGEAVGTPTTMAAKIYSAGAGFVYRKKAEAMKAIADIVRLGGMAELEA